MKVLVIGSGGREHTIAWKISQSSLLSDLYIAPGNPGTATVGENVPIEVSAIDELLAFAQQKGIDLTIVGPEQPLVDGIVDAFTNAGLKIFGPTAAAAELEGSKAFAKAFMERQSIPTARHRTFSADAYDEARAYISSEGGPIVLKASGLAAGKGVLVCMSTAEALAGLDALMKEGQFGEAGASVVVEEFMEGEEASIFALTDGSNYVLLSSAQDHKRIGEGDTGPNTGGMGAYAPAPIVTDTLLREVEASIIEPTLAGMQAEGRTFQGILYVGLMISDKGARVVEYNCRLGDPETQVILPLLQGDLLQIIHALVSGRGAELKSTPTNGAAACIVMASEGYPGSYPKGKEIHGLAEAALNDDVVVFHAGTCKSDGGGVETSGGRVLGVTATADGLREALDKCYGAISHIEFEGKQFRTDIGQKGLARLDQ